MTTKFADEFSTQITGLKTMRNHSNGIAVHLSTPSALVIAIIFGACSPTITCAAVTIRYAIPTEIATATPWLTTPPKTGSIRLAIAGSPRNPSPIEAIVIPTCAAERYSSIRSIA